MKRSPFHSYIEALGHDNAQRVQCWVCQGFYSLTYTLKTYNITAGPMEVFTCELCPVCAGPLIQLRGKLNVELSS